MSHKRLATKTPVISGFSITRERFIQLLIEDLAEEYTAVIACTRHSRLMRDAEYTDIAQELEVHAGEELQHAILLAKQIQSLGGIPEIMPRPVNSSNDPVEILRTDLCNKRQRVMHYRERRLQAEELGESGVSETLHAIIVQEQEIETTLSAALLTGWHRSRHQIGATESFPGSSAALRINVSRTDLPSDRTPVETA